MSRQMFDLGLLCGILLMVCADAMHWFIATWQPGVSSLRTSLVALQFVLALGGSIYLLSLRARRPGEPAGTTH